MKSAVIILLLCSLGLRGYAQILEEWTEQKKTQIKYLKKQIEANHAFIDYLQKGYEVTKGGLDAIQAIKNGDFGLHADFFESFQLVNSKIKDALIVGGIIEYNERIVKNVRQSIRQITDDGMLDAIELKHCHAVMGNLFGECLKNLQKLATVILDRQLSMSDDERMKSIVSLYGDMQDKYAFAESFCSETGVLSAQRLAEKVQLEYSKRLEGFK